MTKSMLKKLKFGLPLLALPFCAICGVLRRKKYRNIHFFCCFIGYSRSGHTIVGSLLDAHPNIVISTEAHAFNLVKMGYGKNALMFYLEIWSKIIFRFFGNKWTGYDYQVKDSNQGFSKSISIIGDKKGSGSLKAISVNPELPDKLREVVRLPVKYIHVIRNPVDIISTMYNMNSFNTKEDISQNRKFSRKILKRKIRSYFNRVRLVQRLIDEKEMQILNVYHEKLISSPEETLKSILEFLGVEADHDFLRRCADIIYESPNKSRHSIEWPERIKGMVQEKCNLIPFLENYSFDK